MGDNEDFFWPRLGNGSNCYVMISDEVDRLGNHSTVRFTESDVHGWESDQFG